MQQDEFRKWLVAQGQTEATASSRASSARRVEQYLGDLDELFAQEDRDSVLNRFAYTAEDERAERPNPSPVPIDGVLRAGLASLQQALKLYHSFLTEQSNVPDKAEHQALIDRLTRKEIEAAMQECDQLGLKAFLARGGFASPQVWVSDEGKDQTYPAKASVAAALGHLPDGRALAAKEFFNGFGEAQSFAKLEALGFQIIRKGTNGKDDAFTRERIEGAMDAYEEFRRSGAHADAFSSFGEPKDFWVRSSRPRQDKRFPTKPIVGYLLGKASNTFNGGWSQPGDAAARLHAAGYIIVDQHDTPLPLPEQHTHLVRGAERARLVALNYFIEPAREAGLHSVTIRAGDLHDMSGLVKNWANVCQALEKEAFQQLASVPAPTRTGPERSTTTEYTFVLTQDGKAKDPSMSQATQIETTNLILYGPPGTGKTYQTAWEAVRLCLGDAAAFDLTGAKSRDRLMAEYRRLMSEGRIEFVTFHQSMSYEEFVEGLRPAVDGEDPSENGAGFRLEPVAGIFQRVARRAEASAKAVTIHAQDADATQAMPDAPEPNADVFPSAAAEGADNDDLQPQPALAEELFTVGQLPPVRDGTFRKLAQDVALQLAEEHPQGFSLQQYREALVRAGRETGIEPTGGWEKHNMPTWASHPDQAWLVPADATSATAAVRNSSMDGDLQTSGATVRVEQSTASAHVLIIDEINRANISKVFGELITLLEPDKRLGRRDEIQLTLPYSKKHFGVPPNLHIIGTMNTADRSIALLDTALRRRFTFKELMPNPSVLSPNVGGINLQTLLTTINDRIEYLFDREHQIGHAYFTGCTSAEAVEDVMRHKVIPLLSEYFYEDWSKVAAVLGDGPQGPSRFLEARRLTAPPGIAADDFGAERLRWRVKDQFDFSEFAA
ncbi:McrB family protein [Tabrizicola sp. YIM 78059]|uniref:McrB family protein n=1 Tax=Tabrizicola sp. YIM 78059 TaxID=2529861 RepID=UPI0020C0E1CE|nr:AAA family ATPase [Tabrizicola sp. YIM 78059]